MNILKIFIYIYVIRLREYILSFKKILKMTQKMFYVTEFEEILICLLEIVQKWKGYWCELRRH